MSKINFKKVKKELVKKYRENYNNVCIDLYEYHNKHVVPNLSYLQYIPPISKNNIFKKTEYYIDSVLHDKDVNNKLNILFFEKNIVYEYYIINLYIVSLLPKSEISDCFNLMKNNSTFIVGASKLIRMINEKKEFIDSCIKINKK